MTIRHFYAVLFCISSSITFINCTKQVDYHSQESTTDKASQAKLSLSDELVITPAGMYPKSHVHLIEEGYKLSFQDGRAVKVNMQTGKVAEDFGTVEKQALNRYYNYLKGNNNTSAPIPGYNTGWITYAYWTNNGSTPISSLKTTWKVPSAPSVYHSQTIFLFNALQDVYTPANDIIQPVLQYGPSSAGGGKYWSIASWCIIGSQVYHTSLTQVSAGTSLRGNIVLTSNTATAFNYQVSFTGYASTVLNVTNGTGSNTGGHSLSQQRFAAQTLETYGITTATDYPSDLYVGMTQIEMKTGTTYPTIVWNVSNTNADASIGQHTKVISNSTNGIGEVDIYFHPEPPPPPATPKINGQGTFYFSASVNSGSGTINAIPGTTVTVNVTSGGPNGPYTTTCSISGATFASGGTSLTATGYNGGTISSTFVMPSSGYVNWSGSFSEPNSFGSGSISVQ